MISGTNNTTFVVSTTNQKERGSQVVTIYMIVPSTNGVTLWAEKETLKEDTYIHSDIAYTFPLFSTMQTPSLRELWVPLNEEWILPSARQLISSNCSRLMPLLSPTNLFNQLTSHKQHRSVMLLCQFKIRSCVISLATWYVNVLSPPHAMQ